MNDHADTLRKFRDGWYVNFNAQPQQPQYDQLTAIIAALEAGRSGEATEAMRSEMHAVVQRAGGYRVGLLGEMFRAAIAAAPQQPTGRSGEAGDWVMVPRVPTTAMLADFWAVANGQHPMDARNWTLTQRQQGRARSAYARMLAAAPQQPPPVGEGCTPTDARMLRKANHGLADESARLQGALRPLVDAAALMLGDIDTCGRVVDPAYRAALHDAWTQGKAALSHQQPAEAE